MENKSDSTDYEEWLKKIREASGVELKQEGKEKVEKDTKIRKNDFILAGFILLLALIPRIAYMFIFSNPQTPGWYTDVFHHWQIAFLSKEIGFSQGFLRLWDFKGMEYFWGLLHPLILSLLFTITGTISILIPRLLSTFGGSISIILLFFIIRRYFNTRAALAMAIFAAFFPISLFSNTSGMQEELGMSLILLGIFLWPRKPVLIGILFGLASMVRAEYWLFSAGLVVSTFIIFWKNLDRAFFLLIGYLFTILVYMKYLATWTGNAIYPIYWNFFANAKGEWAAEVPIIGEKLLAKQISQGIFVFGLIGIILTFIKRPKFSLLFLFGFVNIAFVGFMLGFTAYVKGYFGRFWLDRLYNWPYQFLAILILILLFYVVPKKLPSFNKIKLNWIIFFILLAVSQITWKPINFYMQLQGIEGTNRGEKEIAREIASAYKGGVILMPEDRQAIVYFLAHDFKIEGKNMEGQMFDPFFYFKDKSQPFSNWDKDRETVLNWLKKDNIRLLVLTTQKQTYLELIKREPFLFKKIPTNNVSLYEIELDKIE